MVISQIPPETRKFTVAGKQKVYKLHGIVSRKSDAERWVTKLRQMGMLARYRLFTRDKSVDPTYSRGYAIYVAPRSR